MNTTYVKIKNYEQKTMNYEPAKQTQSNPIYGEPVEPSKPISLVAARPLKYTSGFVDSLGEAVSVFQAKLFSRKEVFIFLYLLKLRP